MNSIIKNTLFVLALGMITLPAFAVTGKGTVQLTQVKAVHEDGTPAPKYLSFCNNYFVNHDGWAKQPVTISFKVDTKSYEMSASALWSSSRHYQLYPTGTSPAGATKFQFMSDVRSAQRLLVTSTVYLTSQKRLDTAIYVVPQMSKDKKNIRCGLSGSGTYDMIAE